MLGDVVGCGWGRRWASGFDVVGDVVGGRGRSLGTWVGRRWTSATSRAIGTSLGRRWGVAGGRRWTSLVAARCWTLTSQRWTSTLGDVVGCGLETTSATSRGDWDVVGGRRGVDVGRCWTSTSQSLDVDAGDVVGTWFKLEGRWGRHTR